jgi:malate dehydrogenase (oxaloacetate-decarboxylating)(NADP+)
MPSKEKDNMIKREESLEYHASGRPGKIELRVTKPCLTPWEMRLAYLPGASYPSTEIVKDPGSVFRYTLRGNLVAVITNGTAVPGLGDVGAAAAKPMQEGVAMLFKRLADIDVFDLELDTKDPDHFVETVQLLEPTFGGINLKDISAPEGLLIYERLCTTMGIPVFHENLYSSAVVATAALINALELAGKRIDEIQVVICGAGTVGIGCARLFVRLGVRPENLLIYDVRGLIHPDRNDLLHCQREFARKHSASTLLDGARGADVLVGASTGAVFTLEMLRSMSRFPLVLALATPEPEIGYQEARGSRQDIIVATSSGLHPNTLTDLLSFPYIFRGALDVQAKSITQGMMLAAARALARLAREEVVEEVEKAYGNEHFSFGPEYLLPKPIDPRILIWESAGVSQQAIDEKVACKPIDTITYQESLAARLGTGREILRGLMLRARQEKFRVVFSQGSNETILRASRILHDEGIAIPILLGREEDVRRAADRLGLDLGGVDIIDPDRSPRLEAYTNEYFRMRRRRGVIRPAADERVRNRDYFASMMVHTGDADMMIAGLSTHYVDTLRTIIEVIGPAPGIRRISSHHLVLLSKDVAVLADCTVNIDPNSEELAEIALLAARTSRSLGIEPRVAMLSFSNFGSVDHPLSKKIRRAAEIAKEKAGELSLDGEMQLLTARKESVREEYFPFAELKKDANVLVFPDLQSGNLTMHSLQCMGEANAIGPILMGTRLPAHVLQYGSNVESVVNLVAIAVVEAAELRKI